MLPGNFGAGFLNIPVSPDVHESPAGLAVLFGVADLTFGGSGTGLLISVLCDNATCKGC